MSEGLSFEQWREAYRRADLHPKCATWKCPADAVGWLYAPDGEANPAWAVCEKHGEEFREKINEKWSIVPILDHYARQAVKGAAS
jgi:hypothetical protein